MPKQQDSLRKNKQQQVQKQVDTSSFICSLNRNMFEQIIQSKNKNKKSHEGDVIIQNEQIFIAKNLLKIEPKQINSISWPQIYMPDADLYISLKGNFYLIKDSRNNKKYINRNAQPNSEIVYFKAVKSNQKITNLISVSKFIKINNDKLQLSYHIDLVIFDSFTDSFKQYSVHQKGFIQIKQTSYNLQFKSIQFISKYTKAIIVFEALNLNNLQYQIYLLDLTKQCKQQKINKQIKQQQNYSNISATLAYNPVQNQHFIKIINSQYGDNVLFITTSDIFEIQIINQQNNILKIKLKAFLISIIFQQNTSTYLSSKKLMQKNTPQLQYKPSFKKCEQIIDIQYTPNTLNLQILTNYGRIFQLQSQAYKLAQSLYEILHQNHLKDYYNIQNFIFTKLYSLKDLIVIYIQSDSKSESGLLKNIKHRNQQTILNKQEQGLTHQNINRGLLLIRKQQHTFVFYKFVSLPFQLKQFQHFIIHPNKYSLQILIETINKNNLDTLQLYNYQILSTKNSFIPFQKFHYIKDQKINLTSSFIQKKQIKKQNSKQTVPIIYFQKTSKSFLILQDNLIHGYKMYTNQLDNTFLYGINKTFSIQTFQKPNKLIIHPLTNIIVVLYKQFIKFYHNNYSELRNYHILNLRNVSDINFSKNGEFIILSHSDNNIYLIDFYRFNQKKIISFYFDVKQVHYISQKIISVKSIKNHLNVFKKKQKVDNIIYPKQQIQQYEKLYQIQIVSGDLQYINEEFSLIVKKNGKIQVFSHNITKKVLDNQKTNEKMNNLQQKGHHQNLIYQKQIKYQNGQYPTSILFSQQLLILFIGTNYGNLIQILYPFFSIDHQNYLICYKLPVTYSMIVHLQMSATLNSMVIISEKLQIIQVQFIQYINGLKMNGIYKTVLSDKLNLNLLKYQYANRNYLHEKLAIIGQTIKNTIKQNFDEHSFINDKLKDDLQDTMNKIKYQSTKNINSLTQQHKTQQQIFKQQFQKTLEKFTLQNQLLTEQINNQLVSHKKLIQQYKKNYQKQILQIYKQYDRLQALKKSSLNQYKQIINRIHSEFIQILHKQQQIRKQQIQSLQDNYKKVADKYYFYKITVFYQQKQNQQQLNKMKNNEIDRLQNQLKQQELKKQKYLSYFNKTEGQIEKYRNRTNSFQNLIVEAKHQISQLINENRQYNHKKTFLYTQLYEKQQIIEDKQSQIILFMKNNNQIIIQKNVHQFQLSQNQNNLIPIKKNIQKLEQKMQKMNKQIQDQYQNKISNIKNIQNTKKTIQKLKQKHQKALQLNVVTKSKYYRFQKQLAFLTQNYNDTQIKQKLTKILFIFSKNQQKNNVINKQSIQINKTEGQKLIRKKNMLMKQIQKQERGQNGILRNKHQFVKYYVENTKIVKQYNQLSQEHGILLLDKNKLEEKIKNLKEQIYNTPIQRSQSMYISKKSQIKLTPFQRYQQYHFGEMMKSKIQQSIQTKASKQDSSNFLKSLIKDVGSTDNQYTKSVLVRDRIRSFINPQIAKIKHLQKQLFQGNRNRRKSNFLKL